jgi:hypothetical protein
MPARPIAVVAPVLAAFCAGPALAQTIIVERLVGSVWQPLAGVTGKPSGSNLAIALTASDTVRIYADNPALTDIGLVTVTCPDTASPTILIARSAPSSPTTAAPLGTSAARSIRGLSAAGRARVQINAGALGRDGVEAFEVVRLDLAGDLDGPVIHWGSAQDGPARGIAAIVVGGSITQSAPIVAVNGRIAIVDVAGDVRATLAAQNGGFGTIDIAGSLGAADTPADLFGWSGAAAHGLSFLLVGGDIGHPSARGSIQTGGAVVRIEADAVHAHIDTLLDASDPADLGFLGGLICRTGALTGSLAARTLTSFGGWSEAPCRLAVAGDLEATVILENGLRNENPTGPEIEIRGALAPDALISAGSFITSNPAMPGPQLRIAGPLRGQVIAGTDIAASFADPASIQLGLNAPFMVTPDTKHYATLFGDLGGGAVGVAPFNFHPLECFPQHNETIQLAQGERLEGAVVRLYGPAFAADPTMVVEHRADPAAAWTDRSADFAVLLADEQPDADREVAVRGIAGAHFEPGEWRLRPADESIRCAFTRGTPAVVFDSEYDDNTYRFIVAGGCQPRTGGGARIDGDDRFNDLRDEDHADNVNPVDPGTNPCP